MFLLPVIDQWQIILDYNHIHGNNNNSNNNIIMIIYIIMIPSTFRRGIFSWVCFHESFYVDLILWIGYQWIFCEFISVLYFDFFFFFFFFEVCSSASSIWVVLAQIFRYFKWHHLDIKDLIFDCLISCKNVTFADSEKRKKMFSFAWI